MKFSVTAVFAIAGLAAAAPQRPSYPAQAPPAAPVPTTNPYGYNPGSTPYGRVTCLTDATAKTLVTGFASLLTSYSDAVADKLLSSDFTDTSDSINALAGYPLGSTTFPSKAAFKAGQGAQPKIGFELLNIDDVTCTGVAFRWSGTPNLGNPSIKVKGINSLVASNLNGTDQGWQIKSMYSEFNSCTWMQAVGGKCGFS